LAAITNRLALPRNITPARLVRVLVALLEGAVVFALAQRGWWPLAVAVVPAVELWALRPGGVAKDGRANYALDRIPALLMGASLALIVAVVPRLATQAVVAGLFVIWRVWWNGGRAEGRAGLVNLLLVQVAVFEAVFLAAAIWRPSNWIVLSLVWLGAYLPVYGSLARRGERAAGVLAATWAVVAVEVSWVLLLWLFTYTMSGGYILIPQPALVLTALGYCFGSIYVSQREGSLSRGRLAEYLLIGLILIAIVIVGTSWRGSV
jgi:hypothetical protein